MLLFFQMFFVMDTIVVSYVAQLQRRVTGTRISSNEKEADVSG